MGFPFEYYCYNMPKTKKISKKNKQASLEPQEKVNCLVDIDIQFPNFREIYEEVEISKCMNEKHQIQLKKLIKILEQKFGISFTNMDIKYYLDHGQVWMLCPKEKSFLPYEGGSIKLKLQQNREYIETIMQKSDSEEDCSLDSDEEESQKIPVKELTIKCRRLKERKISEVIEKVLKWRELYAGLEGEKKLSLQDGAQFVRISKKTLDDYLSQIKKGKKYGFNFNEHRNEKIGILREYIRRYERNK